jgi:hypothetical protein
MQEIMKEPEEKTRMRAFYGGLAAGLALIAVLLALAAGSLVHYKSAIRKLDDALLAKLKDGEAVTVVALGNSRLRNALDAGDDPARVWNAGGRELKILKFANDFADLASYDDLLVDILNARPDVLMIQKPLLTVKGKSQAGLFASLSDMGYFWLDQAFRRQGAESYWRETRETIIDDCLPSFRPVDFQETAKRLSFHYYHDLDAATNVNVELARVVIEKALEKGTKVIILDVPANVAAAESLNVPRHVLDYNGLGYMPAQDDLLSGLGDKVTWLSYPAQPAGEYCDFIHLNEEGRKEFTKWFVEELSIILD